MELERRGVDIQGTEEQKPDPVVAVLANTGVGKSTFLNMLIHGKALIEEE